MPNIRRVAAVLVFILAAASLLSAVWKPATLPQATALADGLVPLTLAGYTSAGDRPLPPDVLAVLPGAGVTSRRYVKGDAVLDFLLISGAHGVAIHDPRLCLGGWLLSAPDTERLPGTPVSMQVYEASSQADTPPDLLVAYFYVAGGRVISSPSQIRASLLWGDLLGRENAPVFFFRFVQPLGSTPDAHTAAHARLQTFAGQMWGVMQPKIETATGRRVRS